MVEGAKNAKSQVRKMGSDVSCGLYEPIPLPHSKYVVGNLLYGMVLELERCDEY